MDSRSTKRDEQEELLTTSIRTEADESTSEPLSADEERRIVSAMTSIEAGRGLPFEDVFRELEDFETL